MLKRSQQLLKKVSLFSHITRSHTCSRSSSVVGLHFIDFFVVFMWWPQAFMLASLTGSDVLLLFSFDDELISYATPKLLPIVSEPQGTSTHAPNEFIFVRLQLDSCPPVALILWSARQKPLRFIAAWTCHQHKKENGRGEDCKAAATKRGSGPITTDIRSHRGA